MRILGKRYNCMYCNNRMERQDLIKHINKVHSDMIPENYSAERLVYDNINKIVDGHGTCRVCKKPTKWNENNNKYDILCDNPKCKEALRELYKKNMLRVRGTYNILNNPEQQKLMLSHRKISGEYKHTDGGIIQYTGDYERKFLEFMDTFLNIPSKEIISPGPTIEYYYHGEKHFYIPDFILPTYNLIIEIKDGGDNVNGKNTPSMIASREKTLEKERIITDKGEYNYLRLTNNQFEQLIDIFMQIKDLAINGEFDSKRVVRVNENYTLESLITDKVFSEYKENKTFEMLKRLLEAISSFRLCGDNVNFENHPYFYRSIEDIIGTKSANMYDMTHLLDYILTKYFNMIIDNDYKCFCIYLENNFPIYTFVSIYRDDKVYWLSTMKNDSIDERLHEFNSDEDLIRYIINKMKIEISETHKEINWCTYHPNEIPPGTDFKTLNKIFEYLCVNNVYTSHEEKV